MKELFQLFEKDIMSENFSKRELVIYGIVAPLALIAICILADFINTL